MGSEVKDNSRYDDRQLFGRFYVFAHNLFFLLLRLSLLIVFFLAIGMFTVAITVLIFRY